MPTTIPDTRHATGRYRNHDIAVLSLFDFFDETVQPQWPSYVDGVVARAAAPFFVYEKSDTNTSEKIFLILWNKTLAIIFQLVYYTYKGKGNYFKKGKDMKEDRFIAHKRENEIETVKAHLNNAAEKAFIYGSRFGCGEYAANISRNHDLGKMTERFLRVIFGKTIGISHAISSAQVVFELNGERMQMEDRIMYDSIYGHHSYLSKQFSFLSNSFRLRQHLQFPTNLNDHIDGKMNAFSSREEFEDVREFARRNNMFRQIDVPMLSRMDSEELMLFSRMIHSCCVDADYSSTAEFMNPGLKIEERYLDAEKMYQAILEKKHEFDTNPNKTPMQGLRDRVYEDCCNGKSLKPGLYKISAPTGLGKTMASMVFAVNHARAHGQNRIFIVLPYLAITTQSWNFYMEMFKALGLDYVIEDDSNRLQKLLEDESEKAKQSLQYIERWNAPVVITTSVRFFETLMSSNTPTLRKLHQIANSVIIFDESQTLPTDKLDVTINTLKALPKYYNTTVVLSTATQPAYKYRSNVRAEFDEIITDVSGLYNEYSRVKNTRTTYLRNAVTYDDLADMVRDKTNALIIVNTKKKARALYRTITQKIGKAGCVLLYTNLSKAHQMDVIRRIKQSLENGEKCILVSTQSVEAGVDLDFSFGMRELAPWTSLVQAAGRINRNGNGHGEYFIFELDETGQQEFPDEDYKCRTAISKKLLEGLDETNVNLYDLNVIDEYYRKCFQELEKDSEDRPKIQQAVKDLNVHALDDNYHIIENKEQVTVLVSYGWTGNSHELSYEQFIAKLRNNNYKISKKEMRLYRKYAVTTIADKKTVEMLGATCKRLYTYGDPSIALDWYIDDCNVAYDVETGLKQTKEEVNANDGCLFM